MRAPEVLVIGDANPDLVLSGDVEPRFGQVEKLVDAADLVLGGSAAIVATGLARLGVPTALAATVGDDAFGRFATHSPPPASTLRGLAPTATSLLLSPSSCRPVTGQY
jgi:hypothetical protein